MQLFSCGAGRVKTYRQWQAWVELGRLRFSAEFALPRHRANGGRFGA